MAVERIDAPYEASEREMLNAWLNWHRATLEQKCDGLTGDQLRERAVPPSSMSLLGLVRHMAEVERGWFRRTLGGESFENAPLIYCTLDDNPDGDFDDVDTADVAEAFATWKTECDLGRKAEAAASSLDVIGISRRGNRVSLRWILVHMIEEYARHNGHADLLRERIDGQTGY
ncbi:MAG: DinB family protein [Micromonosporaceae bacterium]